MNGFINGIASPSGMEASRLLSRRGVVAGMGATAALVALGGFGLTGCTPSKAASESPAESEDYDAVIVGTGGAGLSAAIAAYDRGLTNIVILEKMAVNGGNTNYSSSGMNASETTFQKDQGIEDSNDAFAAETLEGGHDTGDPELVQFMCDNSAGAIDWLDGLGRGPDPGSRPHGRRGGARDSGEDELRGQGAAEGRRRRGGHRRG